MSDSAKSDCASSNCAQDAFPRNLFARGARTSWFYALLLLLGVGCRFYGLNWDEGALLHPDERFCLYVAGLLERPHTWSEFFNSGLSPLNPNYFPLPAYAHYVYGQLPLFLLKLVAVFGDGTPTLLQGRALSATFDTLTVGFTVLIARRLFGTRDALFAGALVSLAALHIQQSHFFVTDTFTTTFLTASFWAGTRFLNTKRTLDAALLGLFWGLALACKMSAALFGVGIVAFLVSGLGDGLGRRDFKGIAIPTIACLVIALMAFRLGQPMAFRGAAWGGVFDLRLEPRFWRELAAQGFLTRGEIDAPFNVQWVGTKSWLFPFENLGSWGYGWAFWLSELAGLGLFVFLLCRSKTGDSPATVQVLVVAALLFAALFGVQGAAFSKFSRYYLPLTPIVAFFATYFWREVKKNQHFAWGAPIVALCTLLWAVSVTAIYSGQHPRLLASRWITSHIAPGTFVANETAWDDALPLSGPNFPDAGNLHSQDLQSFAPDTPKKREEMIRILNQSEWIFCSSGRSWQNIPRWPKRWPLTTRFYAALWDGSLGFHIEREWTNAPRLGPWQFPDGNAEEALHVYDHPRVILWKKNVDYSPQKVREILASVALPSQKQWIPRQAG